MNNISFFQRVKIIWDRLTIRRLVRCHLEDSLNISIAGNVQLAGKFVVPRPAQALIGGCSSSEFEINWPAAKCYRLIDVSVVGKDGNVFLPDRRVFSVCPWVKKTLDSKIRRPIRWGSRKLVGRYFHLLGRNHENHGHFLFQYLPRLIGAESYLPDDFKILIAPGHKHWQERYLKLLGFGPERIVEASHGTLQVPDLFYVPLLSGSTPLGDSKLMVELFNRLQSGAQKLVPEISSPPAKNTAVFISRSDAPDRKLINENELIAVAKRYFQNVDLLLLSGMNFQEQLRAFARAEFIVGEPGMGLSNFAFIRNRHLLCMESDDDSKKPGWEIAYALLAELAGNRTSIVYSGSPRQKNRDWIYPVDKFEQELKLILMR